MRLAASSFPPVFPLLSDTVISPLFPGIPGRFPLAIGTQWFGANGHVAMATIVARKRADGPRFTARIRLTRDGDLIHEETKTFSTKAAARESRWHAPPNVVGFGCDQSTRHYDDFSVASGWLLERTTALPGGCAALASVIAAP